MQTYNAIFAIDDELINIIQIKAITPNEALEKSKEYYQGCSMHVDITNNEKIDPTIEAFKTTILISHKRGGDL